jgi:hypothetical protein
MKENKGPNEDLTRPWDSLVRRRYLQFHKYRIRDKRPGGVEDTQSALHPPNSEVPTVWDLIELCELKVGNGSRCDRWSLK